MAGQGTADRVRARVGAAIFERVAGPQGPERRRVIQAEGERMFAEDRPVRRVHGDSSMFIGGIRALLLQSLHPLAMAAVAGHSGYRGDPWGRLQRTSYFLAVTTFGRVSDAQEAISRVRAIHGRVTGTAPDGRPYAASDPHLLTWVHIAEADSFLRAHSRFGAHPLDQPERDGYVADLARIGTALGVPEPPRTEAELAERIAQYRDELAATAQAREAARFLLLNPPLPVIARVRAIHRRVTGIAPDGRPYAASDPHLLTWVHIAEADSFLRAHARFGAQPLDQAGRDGYVADLARIGAALGVPDPPRTEAELAARIAEYRPELAGTAQAREAARFLLLSPPLPLVARAPYGVLAAAAVSLLPGWARRPLYLPRLPVTEVAVVRPAGHAMVHAIRWATTAPSPAAAT